MVQTTATRWSVARPESDVWAVYGVPPEGQELAQMTDTGKDQPQPDAHVVVLTSLPPHEAPLLIGRLEEAGIRAIASPGGSSPGQWTALPSVPGLAANAVRAGLVDVLVDEQDLTEARSIAGQWGAI